MSNDTIAIQNSLTERKVVESPQALKWYYDKMKATYQAEGYTNEYKFDNQDRLDADVDWSQSLLHKILTYTTTGATGIDVTSNIAFKESVLSSLYALRVEDAGDQILTDEQKTAWINNMRLVLENDKNWLEAEGRELLFALDTQDTAVIAPTVTTATTGFANIDLKDQKAGEPISTVTSTNVLTGTYGAGAVVQKLVTGNIATATFSTTIQNTYNQGLHDRIRFFRQHTVVSSTSCLKVEVFIPLRYISDWFNQLNFIHHGQRYKMRFQPSCGSSTNTYPMHTLCDSDLAIGGGVTGGWTIVEQPEIWMKRYVLEKPFEYKERTINFVTANVYDTVSQVAPTSAGLAKIERVLIAQQVKDPIRIWALRYNSVYGDAPATYKSVDAYTATTSANSKLLTGSAIKSTDVSTLTNTTDPAGLQGLQLYINGQAVYQNPIDEPIQFWHMLKEEFPNLATQGVGSLINYESFLRCYRYHCLSLKRIPHTDGKIIEIDIQQRSNQASTIVFIIEQLKTITLKW